MFEFKGLAKLILSEIPGVENKQNIMDGIVNVFWGNFMFHILFYVESSFIGFHVSFFQNRHKETQRICRREEDEVRI